MKREDLVKGTILKDNLMGIEWKVLDPETLEVESVNGSTKITIDANKLDNFVIVSTPVVVKETPVQQTINFGLNNGYIINRDTGKKVCNQGELRFNYLFTRTKDKGFVIVAQVTDSYYAGKKKGNVYRYYFKRDKFEKILENEYLDFFTHNSSNGFLETKKYYFTCMNATGTYGDFQHALYYVFDKKFNKLCFNSFFHYMCNPIILKDNGDEAIGVIITNRSTGMCSVPNALLVFVKITKEGLVVLNEKPVLLGGDYKRNCVTTLTKKNLIGVCNGTHFGIYDAANNYSLIESYQLGITSEKKTFSLKNFKLGSRTTIVTLSDGENDINIKVLKTKDRGIIVERI